MSDHKKNQITAEDQKASGASTEAAQSVAEKEHKKKIRKAPKVKKPRKKGLPIAVDILIVVVLLALIAGAVFGIRALDKKYATLYGQREITYTLLAEQVDAEIVYDKEGDCTVQPKTDVFFLLEESTTLVGKVLSVSSVQNDDGTVDLYVAVRATADYHQDLGFFVQQTKIAVGKTYTCRFSGLISDAVIVELQVMEGDS